MEHLTVLEGAGAGKTNVIRPAARAAVVRREASYCSCVRLRTWRQGLEENEVKPTGSKRGASTDPFPLGALTRDGSGSRR